MAAVQQPEIEPVVMPAARALVVQHLRRVIHLGHYPVGSKLPPERVLAPQLGVSRVTLREAIRALEEEGLLRTRRGAAGGASVLGSALAPDELRRVLRDRREELLGLLEFRLVNERLASQRAASRATPADLAALEQSIAAMRSSDGIGSFRQADSAFHLTIAAMADFELLERGVVDARVAMFLPLDIVGFEIVRDSSVRGHEKVLVAIRDGDADRAGRAMASHIRTTTRELKAVLA